MIDRELIKQKTLDIKKLKKECIIPIEDVKNEMMKFLLYKDFIPKSSSNDRLSFFNEKLNISIVFFSYHPESGSSRIMVRNEIDNNCIGLDAWNVRKDSFEKIYPKIISYYYSPMKFH